MCKELAEKKNLPEEIKSVILWVSMLSLIALYISLCKFQGIHTSGISLKRRYYPSDCRNTLL